MGLGDTAIVAFVPSTDLDRSRAFYCGVLGLAFEGLDGFACVLSGGGTTVRVTRVGELAPQAFTVLGWEVADIEAVARDLAGRGVEFLRGDGVEQDELGIWTAPGGARVAWFHDPDGNTLSLTQH
jgi:catechol 2,3-dioxygenase-like lactoylglutathione lyase family enzyme